MKYIVDLIIYEEYFESDLLNFVKVIRKSKIDGLLRIFYLFILLILYKDMFYVYEWCICIYCMLFLIEWIYI